MVDIPALLQVRDISTNEAWQDAMHLSVPVLAVLNSEGQEVSQPHRAQHGILFYFSPFFFLKNFFFLTYGQPQRVRCMRHGQGVRLVHTTSHEWCSTGMGCCPTA